MAPQDLSTKDLLVRNPHHRVWGYVRVSSAKQEHDSLSLDGQREAIQKYCRREGLSDPLFVQETASAGKALLDVNLNGTVKKSNTAARHNLLQLLSFIADMDGAHLIFWRLDRLSRTQMDQELLLKIMWKNNVTVHSTFEAEKELLGIDGEVDPIRRLMRQVMASFTEYERAVIQLRLDAGLMHKASRGGYTGGRPHFGYDVKDSELIINPYKAKMVRYIFYLRLAHGMSYSGISDTIKAHKDPADPRDYHRKFVSRVLKNETVYRGRYVDRFDGVHDRPDLTILPDSLDELQQIVQGEQS